MTARSLAQPGTGPAAAGKDYCEPVANRPVIWQRGGMTLDLLPTGKKARIVSIDWSLLVDEEAQRLRALGFDEGAKVAVAHRGILAGRDPLAIAIGRMTVALRRVHACAMEVAEL